MIVWTFRELYKRVAGRDSLVKGHMFVWERHDPLHQGQCCLLEPVSGLSSYPAWAE